LTRDELTFLLDEAVRLRRHRSQAEHVRLLAGCILGLMFEKPSMRTRVSFDAAVSQCGGSCVFMTGREVGLGERETVKDFARVASQYLDVMAARTFAHQTILDLAKYSSCPVINALSDREHPCQALADLCTIRERRGDLKGKRLVFVGDGNNVARSLAHAAALAGMSFVLAAPPGYQFDSTFLAECKDLNTQAQIAIEADPLKACTDADVLYTDVWASMGQEDEAAARRQVFISYQVNAKLMARAKSDALFMHCLPAHRGDEVTDDVIDSSQSVVVEQAGNRLHVQKALILWLLDRIS
jgi:ornithine carbamoyltransferase